MFIILLHWLLSALLIMLTAYLVPSVHVASFATALIVSIVLGLVNAIIRPLLVLLTLPLTILTFGLFTLVINALMVMLAASVVKGFDVGSFWSALVFSVVLSIFNLLLG